MTVDDFHQFNAFENKLLIAISNNGIAAVGKEGSNDILLKGLTQICKDKPEIRELLSQALKGSNPSKIITLH